MKRRTSCSICYQPVWMDGCMSYAPILFCETKGIKKTSHRRKIGK